MTQSRACPAGIWPNFTLWRSSEAYGFLANDPTSQPADPQDPRSSRLRVSGPDKHQPGSGGADRPPQVRIGQSSGLAANRMETSESVASIGPEIGRDLRGWGALLSAFAGRETRGREGCQCENLSLGHPVPGDD